jgi:hypothetical protein
VVLCDVSASATGRGEVDLAVGGSAKLWFCHSDSFLCRN